eukprot:gnl/MRDRNA2_/MRDRNA2_302756_c0_seq1.p1 gnl/MRDRNA2_/MRDRNA2_302756_c0~~gnl/MRDRNA2_/MRDRNA2_302756_c0_seq1.p1  ORF type:complete len:274 (+),score=38.72 gnl/MRDRNA2_/MRDRNA2_302756_c0_seq1:102-824(+)
MSHLRSFHDIDIHLDAFPYAGTTTTCESLFMGVPVISLRARRPMIHAANVAGSLLTNVGHPEWFADDSNEYVRIATEFAAHPEKIARIRCSLRSNMLRSTLCDAKGLTRHLEDAFYKMKRRGPVQRQKGWIEEAFALAAPVLPPAWKGEKVGRLRVEDFLPYEPAIAVNKSGQVVFVGSTAAGQSEHGLSKLRMKSATAKSTVCVKANMFNPPQLCPTTCLRTHWMSRRKVKVDGVTRRQ